MKNTLILLFLFGTVHLAVAQTKNFMDIPYLETSARVDTLVTPDKIYLSITITEKDSKGRKSVEEQENKMAQAFRGLGIDLDKQLFIKDLSSNFKKYFLRQKDVLKSKRFSLLVYSGKAGGRCSCRIGAIKYCQHLFGKNRIFQNGCFGTRTQVQGSKKSEEKS